MYRLNLVVLHVVLCGNLLLSIFLDQESFSVFSEWLKILIDNLFWSRAVGSDIADAMGGETHI